MRLSGEGRIGCADPGRGISSARWRVLADPLGGGLKRKHSSDAQSASFFIPLLSAASKLARPSGK